MDVLELRPISTGAPDDEVTDRAARYDFEVAAENYQRFHTRRRRECRYPKCETKLRYSRRGEFCSRHEDSTLALAFDKSAHKPGRRSFKLPGLRKARIESGLTPAELGELMGRSADWVYRLQRGAIGVYPAVMLQMAEILGVSEERLLAGVFVKRGGGRPKRGSE